MEDMFKELRSVMDKFLSLCQNGWENYGELAEEEDDFYRNLSWYFAKAIFNEVPESDKVAKLILLMYEK